MEHEVIVTLLVILLVATGLLVVTSFLASIRTPDRKPSIGLILFMTVGFSLGVAFLVS